MTRLQRLQGSDGTSEFDLVWVGGLGDCGNGASRFDGSGEVVVIQVVLRRNAVHQLLRRRRGDRLLPEIGTFANASRDDVLAGVLKHARVVFWMIRQGSLLLGQGAGGDARGFALGAAGTPVAPAVAPCGNEGKPHGEPVAQAGDAEGGGHIERSRDQCHRQDAGAGIIQVMRQDFSNGAADDAFNRNDMQPAQVAGKQAQQRGHKNQAQHAANEFRNRGTDRPGTKPDPAQSTDQQGHQEGRQTLRLQQQVAESSAEQTSPVMRGTAR